ncbi:DUF2520 domain-containing protein [Porifericola rhodea]|uniref:Rossmann-like and DUF2520 domain-containing protein n=1 Tax=Porifericola rhodea TaxID=930972 RepID=UPI0026657CE2|nr:Rossmann-like and DUF2520 domain-containing protein [Porifericola rhodea]WKN31014.1 DUF2520 domain-containing protein [Porifericola rhodea]
MFLKKKVYYRISIVGAGNVASHLAPVLEGAGHEVVEVYSRQFSNAEQLCEGLYNAVPKADLDFSGSNAQIFIIAVPDQHIVEVARQIVLPEGSVLVHTSGSIDMGALENDSEASIGVFYPLQTFTKNTEVNFKEIPLLVEGEDKATLKIVKSLAESLSRKVHEVDSEQRAVLHIAAVFSCNFTNHMITIAQDMVESHAINFELLKPLIAETISKSLNIGPKAAQTGPARRGDQAVVDKHTLFLEEANPELAQIYRLISQNIVKSS